MKLFDKLFKKNKSNIVFDDLSIEKSFDVSTISQSDFEFTQFDANLHDTKFETKPVSYFKDCFLRFAKNKASIVAGIIIGIVILYALIVPAVDPKANVPTSINQNGLQDSFYSNVLPKAFEGTGFWDGTSIKSIGENQYKVFVATDKEEYGNLRDKVVETYEKVENNITVGGVVYSTSYSYNARIDSYALGGIDKVANVTEAEYNAIKKYEEENNLIILLPFVDYESYVDNIYQKRLEDEGLSSSVITSMINSIKQYYTNGKGNYWFQLEHVKNDNGTYTSNSFVPVGYGENADNLVDIYLRDSSNNLVYSKYEGENSYNIRVNYENYFQYKYGFEAKFLFGMTSGGRDIWTRLAQGARFSLILGVCISVVNFVIGIIWGAIAGYYGGRTDLIMERITDIISAIPSIVILNIINTHLSGQNVVGLICAFIISGWIGTAGLTRMQFYRFKGQEYVLASRTLGAKDARLIFKHIFPNAIGTLVTSSVLMIPSVIFSESSLTFLGIINLGTMVSVGTLLNEGQASMTTYPHAVVFPAILISVLMISFNLFGNGLRDAFNTTLRGADD